jgi:hypothetical protein
MALGLPVAAALFAAQAATAAPPPAASPPKAADRCPTAGPPPTGNEIVICVQKPEGYRLNPDLMEARRQMKSGHVKRPESYKDTSCSSVGPMGCGPPAGINLMGAALTAAEMASRLAKGQEIGSMFETEKQPTEYEVYQQVKREREEKEAIAAAKKRLAERTAAAAAQPQPAPQPAPGE